MTDIKALKFAMQICLLFAGDPIMDATAEVRSDARNAAATLGVIASNAEGFDNSSMDRLMFLESMLRNDGLAVLVYLDHGKVRSLLQSSGRMDLANSLTDQTIGEELQGVVAEHVVPGRLNEWTDKLEEIASKKILASYPTYTKVDGES